MLIIQALLTLLLLLSLCGICRSKDRCFQKSRLEDGQEKLVEESGGDADLSVPDANTGIGSAGNIEMPDRAKRYQIRQRNYDID
jgi:hypothetical protein